MSYIKLANFGNFNEFFILRILCRKVYTAQLIKKNYFRDKIIYYRYLFLKFAH